MSGSVSKNLRKKEGFSIDLAEIDSWWWACHSETDIPNGLGCLHAKDCRRLFWVCLDTSVGDHKLSNFLEVTSMYIWKGSTSYDISSE